MEGTQGEGAEGRRVFREEGVWKREYRGRECRGKCTGEVYGWGDGGTTQAPPLSASSLSGSCLLKTHPPGPRLLAEAPLLIQGLDPVNTE